MFDPRLTPTIPVRAMRLWNSHTQWCQIDNGTRLNQYNFSQLDALLGQASRLSADVEFTFGGTPRWAAAGAYPQDSIVNQCADGSGTVSPARQTYWTDFVKALVTHARGRIHAYELWNEADSTSFWSGGVDAMVRMSVSAAAIIHKFDPSALVLSPSVSATPQGYSFLRQYLSVLPTGVINAIAVHSYTNGLWPEQVLPSEIQALKSVLPSGYAHTPVWSTEGGWGLNRRFSPLASDQGAFVARYDLQMLIHGVRRSYWYGYPNSQWGTLWDGTRLTPAGTATAVLEAWLAGADLLGCTTNGNLWSCNLTTIKGRRARIVWVVRAPVYEYPAAGYRMLQNLSGQSWQTDGRPITVTTAPVLLSS